MTSEKTNGSEVPTSRDVKTSNDFRAKPRFKQRKTFRPKRSFDASSPKPFDNDISWYSNDKVTLSGAASISFPQDVGMDISLSSLTTGGHVTNCDLAIPMPGILNIHLAQTCGLSSSRSSALNIAALGLYSFVVHANSRNKSYDYADYMMYIQSMISCYSIVGHLARLITVANAFQGHSRYFPKHVLQVLMGNTLSGVTYSRATDYQINQLVQNIPQLRTYLNFQIQRLNALWVPKKLHAFERAVWMYSSIYKDDESYRSQYYVFTPFSCYEYDWRNAKLTTKILENVIITGVDSLSWFTSMVDNLLTNQDIGMMSGDTLKAFGEENCFRLNPIPMDLRTEPVYSKEVLTQIHNMTLCSNTRVPWSSASPTVQGFNSDVVQNSNGDLICNPMLSTIGNKTTSWPAAFRSVQTAHPFDIDSDVPSAEEIMIATRLQCTFTTNLSYAASTGVTALITIDSDIWCPLYATVFTLNGKDTNSGFTEVVLPWAINSYNSDTKSVDYTGHFMADSFDWRPATLSVYAEDSGGADPNWIDLTVENIAMECYNLTTIDYQVLKNLNQVALFSEYGLPISSVS